MRKYLISNRMNQEAKFLMYGSYLLGEANVLTYVFRLIGKYDELKREGDVTEIIRFSPETYNRFSYENKGIILVRDRVNQQEQKKVVSRRILFHLSRKWKGYPVIVSTKVAEIIEAMIGYIREEVELEKAFKLLVRRTQSQIVNMMPIQSEFLEVRSCNTEAKHSDIATDILMKLNSVQYNSVTPFL